MLAGPLHRRSSAGEPGLTCCPRSLTYVLLWKELEELLETSRPNLVLSPARIMAVTSSLELEGEKGVAVTRGLA